MTIELARIPESPDAVTETSWWPFLVAATFTVTVSALPLWKPGALVGLVLLLGSVIGWTWSNALREAPPEGTIGGHGRLWWGMILIIVSEAGLFLTGFITLTAHTDVFGPNAPASFQHLNRPLTLLASLVLWSSGFVGAWAMKREGRARRRALLATAFLGTVFVSYQAFEYWRLVGEGFTLASGGAGSIFYFLTGLHGVHVVGGIVALVTLAFLQRPPALRAAMLYWHFVDAAWVAIYAVLYLKLV